MWGKGAAGRLDVSPAGLPAYGGHAHEHPFPRPSSESAVQVGALLKHQPVHSDVVSQLRLLLPLPTPSLRRVRRPPSYLRRSVLEVSTSRMSSVAPTTRQWGSCNHRLPLLATPCFHFHHLINPHFNTASTPPHPHHHHQRLDLASGGGVYAKACVAFGPGLQLPPPSVKQQQLRVTHPEVIHGLRR